MDITVVFGTTIAGSSPAESTFICDFSMNDIKILFEKSSKIKTDKGLFLRIPVKTKKIGIKENIGHFFEYLKKEKKEGDWIALSEKFITISEGRLMHKSLLKPGVLAKIIYRLIRFNMGEKSYKHDPGFAIPEKIQAAIFIAGWWRIFLAFFLSIPLTLISKIFGKKKGWFYILAGNRISEIDGPYYKAMKPFDEFAKIYPENPKKTCLDIEKKYSLPCVIIDGNNINTEILASSDNINLNFKEIRDILIDNPMGQADELTPIILIRKINHDDK